MAPIATYTYTPLASGQIRLFVLKPAMWDDEIHGELQTVCLNDKPKYTALSYRWGRPDRPRCVNLYNEQLPITENLYVALRYLRKENADVVLWIDGVCINQNDLNERCQQVSIMDTIFTRSAYVFAFAGKPKEDTRTAVDLLLELASRNKFLSSGSQFVKDAIGAGKLGKHSRPWDALASLFERAYWQRIWVIQELALNPKKTLIYFGKHHLRLTEFIAGFWAVGKVVRASYAARFRFGFFKGWMAIQPMIRLVKRWSVLTLTECIKFTDTFRASDYKDHVYSLLSLANAHERQLIKPHYEQSSEQFRVEIARLLLESSSDLDCLEGNRYDPSDGSYIEPSWALPLPRIGKEADHSNLVAQRAKWQVRRHAAGNTSRGLKFSADYRCLSLYGVYLDTVKSFVSPLGAGDVDDYIIQIASLVESPEMRRRLWRVLLMDSWLDWILTSEETAASQVRTPAPQAFEISFDDLVDRRRAIQSYSTKIDDSYNTSQFFMQVRNLMLIDRCFFVTESGRTGFGPRATRCGDAVVTFYGAGHCHVLRPRDTQYILLGDAWVDGVMGGEFMNSPARAERERWFDLI